MSDVIPTLELSLIIKASNIMELEKKVELAVARISHILEHESNTITSVTPDDEGSILIHLSNGMNLHLTSGEMEYRAEEQIENNKEYMERHEAIQEIADDYIETIRTDIFDGDTSLLNSIITGDGMKTLNELTDEQLVKEYKELFGKDIIIND